MAKRLSAEAERALNALVDIAMTHLAKYSPEEQERRIAAMEARLAKARRGASATRARRSRTRATRAQARGRAR